jgi:CRISPR-associated protein Csc1
MARYIARCQMTLHDNLYYATREFGRFYETEKYLHNYGLTYALGLVQPAPPYFTRLQEPHYQEELQPDRVGDVYVTPAFPLQIEFAFITFKRATVPYYSSTPKESRNRVIFGRAKELAPGSSFEFFILAEEERVLPRWIRLGKWMAKAEITSKWYRLGSEDAKVVDVKQPQRVICPINPLDIPQERLTTFDIVVMPPASLCTNARVIGPCCKLTADAFFHDRKKEDRYVPLHMSYFGKEATTR